MMIITLVMLASDAWLFRPRMMITAKDTKGESWRSKTR